MNKIQTERAISEELNVLNQIIDQKIIKGLKYKRESLRHRSLLSQLNRIQSTMRAPRNWFSQSMQTVTSFLL